MRVFVCVCIYVNIGVCGRNTTYVCILEVCMIFKIYLDTFLNQFS